MKEKQEATRSGRKRRRKSRGTPPPRSAESPKDGAPARRRVKVAETTEVVVPASPDWTEEVTSRVEDEVRESLERAGWHLQPKDHRPPPGCGICLADGTPIEGARWRMLFSVECEYPDGHVVRLPRNELEGALEMLDAPLLPGDPAAIHGDRVVATAMQVWQALLYRRGIDHDSFFAYGDGTSVAGQYGPEEREALKARLLRYAMRWYDEFRSCRSAAGRAKGGRETALYDRDAIKEEAGEMGWVPGTVPLPRGFLGHLQDALGKRPGFGVVPDRSTLSRILRARPTA